ncbi:PqqD family protein [Marvinbryantia formatexigens]|uniref:PqqD family protein n=1 Tax=Marvinbryantia formatexigens TaxID=168384 RepID=UPI001A9A509D|nr:PqqD family protein [Marvinbryantia formatexigens]
MILREIYGKSILMPIRYNEASNDPIYLNDVAALIWKKVAASNDLYELKKSICEIYELDEDSTEAYSVEKFITQLIENEIIFY